MEDLQLKQLAKEMQKVEVPAPVAQAPPELLASLRQLKVDLESRTVATQPPTPPELALPIGEGREVCSGVSFLRKDEDAIKLFVGQVPKTMEEAGLTAVLGEFGEIFDLGIIRDRVNSRHRGCAFVTYCKRAAAEAAIAALHGRIHLDGAMNPLQQVRPAEGPCDRESKIFVGMVPKGADEADIRSLFEAFGEVVEVHMIRDADGVDKGCAFVKFGERSCAVRAIESLHGSVIMERSKRPLVVKFADQKKSTQQVIHGRGMGSWNGHEQSLACGGVTTADGMVVPMPMDGTGPSATQYWGVDMSTVYADGIPYPYGMPSPMGMQAAGMYMYAPPSPASGYIYPHPQAFAHHGRAGPGHFFHEVNQQQHLRQQQQLVVQQQQSIPIGDSNGRRSFKCPAGDGPHSCQEGPPGANLFVQHLPSDLTDADLATAFTPFGEVLSAKVYVDKYTNESRGFGFVSYTTIEEAAEAIAQMNGFKIGKKCLQVELKKEHGRKGSRGSGRQ
ncbi:unnamed protein product [Chrysoparadoxa australica]